MNTAATVNSQARFIFRNLAALQADLKKYDSKRKSVAGTAVKVELYRLKKVLSGQLKQGQVAGRSLAPLRVVSRGTHAARKPLARLAVAVRYSYKKQGEFTVMSVGFEGPQSSKSWRRIATIVQDGGEMNPDQYLFGTTLRRLWIRIGGDYKKGRAKKVAQYFFLRKKTRSLKMPARPIIAPFWAANKTQSEKNILSNFERKIRGERI